MAIIYTPVSHNMTVAMGNFAGLVTDALPASAVGVGAGAMRWYFG